MTAEWIEYDGKKYQIVYGFGRLQKARYLLYSMLPDAVKRAHIANPDGEDKALLSKATPEEALRYSIETSIQIAKLVLNAADDWDKAKMGVDDYVDGYLPKSVGEEIQKRVQAAIQDAQPDAEKKKDSS